jgi:hypothetical protein
MERANFHAAEIVTTKNDAAAWCCGQKPRTHATACMQCHALAHCFAKNGTPRQFGRISHR